MEWSKEKVHLMVQKQRRFFNTGATLDLEWRRRQLKRLKKMLLENEFILEEALYRDLRRTKEEAYFCDIGDTVAEINEMIAHLKKWARPETHFSGLVCFPSVFTKVYKMPYGVTLVISPFNFPLLLSVGAAAAAIAGGNTVIMKTSSKSPACTKALQDLIKQTFPPEFMTVVDGGHDVADLCLEERFDKIFYTGSPGVGKHVLDMAAKNLTPVALELGGETGNWCVVRKDANLRDAARKVAFFKAMNAGQVCININQIAVAREVADRFVEELKAEFKRQLGENALENKEYPKMINRAAYDKCVAESDQYRDRIVYGGMGDPQTLCYAPTIIYPVSVEEPIVHHELFSPLVSVVPFPDDQVDRMMEKIAEGEHGLSLYLFTKDIKWAKRTMQRQQYGGGCINEVCLHLMVKGVPFNGTGHSGMGSYHGEWGFKEFTHPSTVLIGCTHFNLPLREHPYSGAAAKYKSLLIRLFER